MVWYDISPYVICWVLSCSFAYLASKSKSNIMKFIFSVLSILVPSILAGIRTETVGVDVRAYAVPHYNTAVRSFSFYEYASAERGYSLIGTEIGWYALTYIVAKAFENFNWNLFFYEFVTCTCMYIGAWKHRKFIPLPLTLFVFGIMQFNNTFNVMRQAIACSIIFMGFDSLETKHYLKFSIYIFVASLFHTSAYFAFVYLLGFHALITSEKLNQPNNRNVKNFMLCFLVLFIFFLRPISNMLMQLMPFVYGYSGYTFWEHRNYIVGTMVLGELVVFLLYPKGGRRFFAKNPGGEKMFDFYRYLLIFSSAYYFGPHFVSRGLLYFEYVNILGYASLPYFIREKSLKALISVSVTFALFAFFYLFFMVMNMSKAGSFPYVTIFDN